MNPARPAAKIEYSRGQGGSGGDFGPPDGRPGARGSGVRIAVLAAGMLGAILLAVAEFTPLLEIRASSSAGVIQTIGTGPHHSYALVPVALLAAALAYGIWYTGNRFALLASAVLGVVALLIAVLGDLPDAQASGLIGSAATRFVIASSSPRMGFYLETLGAIVVLISAVSGLQLSEPASQPRPARPGPDPAPGRSAS